VRVCLQFILCLLFSAHSASAEEIIQIDDPWVNEAPPTININAGYLKITNNSMETIELIKAKSDVYERIEFHITKVDDGIAKMEKQDTLSIPAQSILSFSPGGYHLMMFNNHEPVRAGSYIPIELIFSNQTSYHINAEVKRINLSEHHVHHE